MERQGTGTDYSFGFVAAVAVAVLILAYAATLVAGFLSLASPDQPIGDPYSTALEILIIVMMPAIVALVVAIHATAPTEAKSFSLVAVVFAGLLAVVTCCVHFSVLTLSRLPAFAALPGHELIFAFKWPSVVYGFDILAWDVLFPVVMLFCAPAFRGGGLGAAIRVLMVLSALLSFAGLAGVVTGDMQIRNIGIVGYVGVFLVVAVLLAVHFRRQLP